MEWNGRVDGRKTGTTGSCTSSPLVTWNGSGNTSVQDAGTRGHAFSGRIEINEGVHDVLWLVLTRIPGQNNDVTEKGSFFTNLFFSIVQENVQIIFSIFDDTWQLFLLNSAEVQKQSPRFLFLSLSKGTKKLSKIELEPFYIWKM